MKITINRDVLLEGLETTKDSVGKQTALPVLKNVKLTTKDGALKLFTTNLSTGTVVSLRDLSIFSEGEALCDASKLMAVVKELPEAGIRIETDENGHLLMECEKSHFRLFTMSPEEFPSEPEIPEFEFFPINDRFFQYLRNVKYAASRQENRFNINGVFLGTEVVATDGHRMAVIRRKLGFNNILVPLDFVNLILKLRNRDDGNTFQAGCSKNMIFIKSEDLILFGRLIDAEFPDYSQVIPHDSSRYALMERKGLIQAIKRNMLMSGKNYEMKFEFNPCCLIISSFTPDLGDASEEMEIEYRSETDKNNSFAIGINGKYLLDLLEVLEGEKVGIKIGTELSPIMAEEGDFIHILMPLRLTESKPQTESEEELESEAEPEIEVKQNTTVEMEEVN